MDNRKNGNGDFQEMPSSATYPGLRLSVLASPLSVCKCAELPACFPGKGFCSITRTEDEVSIVCETAHVPTAIVREDGWRSLKVEGPLDFGLVGILAKISSALADAGVPLFAISTYDTDYVLIKDETLENAIAALRHAGCEVNE